MGFADKPIRVEGLKDLQRSLKDLDGESQKQLRLVLNDAAEVVASGARRLVPSVSGRARKSIRASSSQRAAVVKAGGAKAKYYGFLDFGGTVGKGHVSGKGGGAIKRTQIKEGRYLYPTFSRRRTWIYDRLAKGLEEAIQNSGLDGS